MTTKLLDNKICTFKIRLSWPFPFPRKNSVFEQFSSRPPHPTLLKNANFIFIVVSQSLTFVTENFITFFPTRTGIVTWPSLSRHSRAMFGPTALFQFGRAPRYRTKGCPCYWGPKTAARKGDIAAKPVFVLLGCQQIWSSAWTQFCVILRWVHQNRASPFASDFLPLQTRV